MTAAGAERGAKAKCGEDGEEESGEPMRETEEAIRVALRVMVAESEKYLIWRYHRKTIGMRVREIAQQFQIEWDIMVRANGGK
jgi:hypothetical protein